MKTFGLVLTLFAGLSAFGQTQTAVNAQQKASAESQSQNAAVISTPPPLPKVVKPARKGEVSGLLADMARTNHPIRVFDLRTPVDPVKDSSNLSTNSMTGRGPGFRLLSIRF